MVQCLKAMSSAITPECFSPSLNKPCILLDRIAYHKCPTICSLNQSNGSESLANVTEASSFEADHDHVNSGLGHFNDEDTDRQKELQIDIPPEVSECIQLFAEHCHNQWVFNKVSCTL